MKKFLLLFGIAMLSMAFILNSEDGKKEKFVVVIDPGHGGKDPGNEVDSITEAQVNLQLAQMLLETKKKTRKNIEFVFTRKGDDFVELEDRIALIDKHKANLFLSIHCDAYTDESINGFQIYQPIKGDHIVPSKKMAKYLEEAILREKTPMQLKSTKPGDMFVITRAHCPAVLVNFGFLTNPEDLATVTSEEYQMAFANAIVSSINTYIKKTSED